MNDLEEVVAEARKHEMSYGKYVILKQNVNIDDYSDYVRIMQSFEADFSDTKETFKAYLATAIDAAKRLCEFIGNNSEDSNHDLFVIKAKQFFNKMTEEIV